MAETSASVTLSNWRTQPHSFWGFQHVHELIPSKQIRKSEQVRSLAKASTELPSDLTIPLGDQRSLSIEQLLAATSTDGFICLHHGKIIYEHYGHSNSAESKHIVFSMTKSITGLITGVLVDQGLLTPHDLVPKHLPELAKSAYAHVTVRHLLDMCSGVIYADTEPEYRAASGWAPAEDSSAKTSLLEFLKTFKPDDSLEPGQDFVYSSINTDVLGLVLERVSGRSLSDLTQEHLWTPAGAETDAFITVDSAGSPRAAGGLCCSVRDMARIGQGLIDGTISSKTWLHDMQFGGDKEAFAASAWGPSFSAVSKNLTYRSCWTVDGDVGLLIAMGIHGQMMIVDLKNDLVMVKTSSQADRSDLSAWGLTYRLFKVIQASKSESSTA